MRLNKLSLTDKKIFEQFLTLELHELSVYAFANIYIWRKLFEIEWAVVEDNLCVFFKDKVGCFLYLSPLGKNKNPKALQSAFMIMDKFNHNKEISRIENAECKDIGFYEQANFSCQIKSQDYLCQREELVNLRGNKFKPKRACINYFTKHYQFAQADFSSGQKDECLKLYSSWMKQRKSQSQDPIYHAMLEDSAKSLKVLLADYRHLDVRGRIVRVAGRMKAFSFGFKLNEETFCLLYEIADLSLKGLSQFIFREFCLSLSEFNYINIMDDSGLANLKRVKLSYRPSKLIPAYIIKRKNY